MKKGTSRNEVNKRMFADTEEESPKKKDPPRRRPIKDWARAWNQYKDDYEDVADYIFKK